MRLAFERGRSQTDLLDCRHIMCGEVVLGDALELLPDTRTIKLRADGREVARSGWRRDGACGLRTRLTDDVEIDNDGVVTIRSVGHAETRT